MNKSNVLSRVNKYVVANSDIYDLSLPGRYDICVNVLIKRWDNISICRVISDIFHKYCENKKVNILKF